MNQSEQINELAAAVAKAQGQFKNIPLTATVEITTKTGGKYRYKYAPLDAIMESVRKPLSENGLAIFQPPEYVEGGQLRLITKLVHSSGQWISCTLPLAATDNDPKTMGSYITYMRRYGLSALLGIVTTEDDDGTSASDTDKGNETGEGKQTKSKPNVDPATGEVIKKPKATNGHTNGDFPDSPDKLLKIVDSRIEATYNSVSHLFNAIKQELGSNFSWPKKDDKDGWRAAYKAAVDHAKKKTNSQQPEPVEEAQADKGEIPF